MKCCLKAFASNDPKQDRNQSYDQKDVNKPSGMKAKKSDCPTND